jgi:hypothetical protein
MIRRLAAIAAAAALTYALPAAPADAASSTWVTSGTCYVGKTRFVGSVQYQDTSMFGRKIIAWRFGRTSGTGIDYTGTAGGAIRVSGRKAGVTSTGWIYKTTTGLTNATYAHWYMGPYKSSAECHAANDLI